jgi:lysophospholipase L1-like esterase
MRSRRPSLTAFCASTLVLGAFACSQSNSVPGPDANDSGLLGTGGAGTGGAVSTGGGTGSGGSAAGGAATGGTTGGVTTRSDAAAATGGQPATGGASGADAASIPDTRPDAVIGDTLSSDTAKDTVMADKPSDTISDTTQADSGSSTCNLTGSATSATPTVYVIGDSTASSYASDLYPRMGWAQTLPDFFAPACATTADKAISGRSSKSFYDEGAWTPIKNALRQGDHVLIQFGHNDEKTDDAARGTDPYTTFQQYLSIYIDDATAKGATPILLTPINRNNWSGTTLQDTHGDYPPAMRDLAQKKQVALVDMTALTKTYFERIGPAATAKLFLILAAGESPNYPSGVTDNTHRRKARASSPRWCWPISIARGWPPARWPRPCRFRRS